MKKYLLISISFISQLYIAQIKSFSGKAISTKDFEMHIQNAMDSLDVSGMSVAVINKGKIVYSKGFGWADIQKKKKVDVSTFFEAASLSKPVFAFFVLKLAKEGKLNIDRPLFEYLPNENITDERYKKITARMVLSHTTGLPNWSETEKIQLESEPGKKFFYSGEAFMYLAKVVAKLNDTSLKNLDSIFQQEVAQPLQLKDFHFVISEKAEQNLAHGYQKNQPVYDERDRTSFDPAGGMYANTQNYGQFLNILMKYYKQYREMFRPAVELEKDNPISQYFGVSSWTLGLAFIKINDSKNFWHGGNNLGYTSSFMINPDKKFGYVYFTNEDQCNGMKKVIENLLWK
ncbi:MAG: serine hydrolase domain-containing protein [Chryseobacterium taeanense]